MCRYLSRARARRFSVPALFSDIIKSRVFPPLTPSAFALSSAAFLGFGSFGVSCGVRASSPRPCSFSAFELGAASSAARELACAACGGVKSQDCRPLHSHAHISISHMSSPTAAPLWRLKLFGGFGRGCAFGKGLDMRDERRKKGVQKDGKEKL